jgi:hypothetical protein
MRMTTIIGAAMGALFFAAAANADPTPPYSVSTSGGSVVVSVGSGYHINKDFPWKIAEGTANGGKVLADKTKWKIDEGKATLDNAPKGTNTLKGAYCSVDSSGKPGACTPFTTTVTVQ